ncbi:MAG: hypothetical protein RLZZ373_1971 [Pseudomonadota bacterium]
MKSARPSNPTPPTPPTWPAIALLAALTAAGGLGFYVLAPGEAPTVTPDAAATAGTVTESTAAGVSAAVAPPPAASLAQQPATLPPGIVLVSTAPDAQPPQATLLLDGRLQVQPQGAQVAGSALLLRGVTASTATLGLAEGPVLYTLPISSADTVRRRLAEARSARLAERAAASTIASVGERVVQRDAGQTAPLPDEMTVTVHRRRPTAPGPVGGL